MKYFFKMIESVFTLVIIRREWLMPIIEVFYNYDSAERYLINFFIEDAADFVDHVLEYSEDCVLTDYFKENYVAKGDSYKFIGNLESYPWKQYNDFLHYYYDNYAINYEIKERLIV